MTFLAVVNSPHLIVQFQSERQAEITHLDAVFLAQFSIFPVSK